ALQDRVLEMKNNPTEAEDKLWQSLRKNLTGYHFRRQHIIDRFVVDFVCLTKNLIIEVDGDIHDYKKEKDKERTDILKTLGFRIIRFKNEEVLRDKIGVIKKIENELKALSFGEGLGEVNSLSLGEGKGEVIKVFTTRADTLFGATYIVLAPEHPLVTQLITHITNKNEVEEYIKNARKKSEIERMAEDKDTLTGSVQGKTGVELKGIKAINPANDEEVPVWIADYVLPDYGTGAIMAVPAHDERDFEFAKKYNLPIIDKPLIDAKEIIKKVGGKTVTKFKLRDWIFSRQRYWGEPIPIINCEKCGLVSVPEKDLPVRLPEVRSYKPTDTGESPLASISKWVNVKCPKCGGVAKRETDTMPNWAGSSWYYLRYTDSKNNKVFAAYPQPLPREGEKRNPPLWGGFRRDKFPLLWGG
ncbi:MAG: Leucine-tRNA ligase, partial [Parcubacteria group bacterium GW2011_GWF2_38_8]